MKQRVGPHRSDEGLPVRLNVALVVGRTAHDFCRLAVPHPIHLEAHLRLGQHRLAQLRGLPRPGAVGGDLDLGDLAMPAPGKARDAVIAGLNLHHARWLRDDGVGFHPQLELPSLAVRKQLGVARRLPSRHPWLAAELEAAQPFDVEVAFEARHHQPHRKTVCRPQRLAVLAVGDESLVHDLVGEGNAAIDARAVAALRQHPVRALVLGDEVDQEFERNAGPFIGADEAMRVLHRHLRIGLFPILPAVAGAFDEHDARDRRHPLQVLDAEHQRLRDHPVDEQPVLRGIDIGHAGMAALVMQIGRRDVADELLMRRLGIDGIAGIDVALARRGLGNAIELCKPGAFAVRAEIGARPSIGDVGERLGARCLGRHSAKDARRQASHEAAARHIRRPWQQLDWRLGRHMISPR
ncbi:hypothetical protein BJS_08737 [Bradyrhizobium japonicum SEMIA 5079]|nr:hypothetical protein BJS_08737 [Bradyrhizobium japonicum SEMIA 5079]